MSKIEMPDRVARSIRPDLNPGPNRVMIRCVLHRPLVDFDEAPDAVGAVAWVDGAEIEREVVPIRKGEDVEAAIERAAGVMRAKLAKIGVVEGAGHA